MMSKAAVVEIGMMAILARFEFHRCHILCVFLIAYITYSHINIYE